MIVNESSHLLWIAREFGYPNYLPLSDEDLEVLDEVTTVETFGSGARLFEEHEPADACYLIRTGTVRLVRDGGAPKILLAIVHSGQMVGDYSMLLGHDHPSSAIAATPVSAIEMRREPIMTALANHPRVALRWLLDAMARVEQAHERVTVLLRKGTLAKVAGFLLSSDGFQNPDGSIEITHEGLAEMVGAERATVSRAIARLRDDGVIGTTRASIEILDERALEEIRAR